MWEDYLNNLPNRPEFSLSPLRGPQTLAEKINTVNLHLSIWATAGDRDPAMRNKLVFTLLHGNGIYQADPYFSWSLGIKMITPCLFAFLA